MASVCTFDDPQTSWSGQRNDTSLATTRIVTMTFDLRVNKNNLTSMFTCMYEMIINDKALSKLFT